MLGLSLAVAGARHLPPAEILSNFQWHLGVLGLILAVSGALLRCHRLALVLLAAGLLLAQPEGRLRGGLRAVDPGPAGLTVLTATVHWYQPDPDAAFDFLRLRPEDVIVLQEICPRLRERLNDIPEFPHRFLHPAGAPTAETWGLGILARRPLGDARAVPLDSAVFPVLDATVSSGSRSLRIRGVHLPHPFAHGHGLRSSALARLADWEWDGDVLLVGDFNATTTSPLLADFLARSGLADGRRGFGRQASWPAALPEMLGIAIDHTFHSASVRVLARELVTIPGSDHRGVSVTLGQ